MGLTRFQILKGVKPPSPVLPPDQPAPGFLERYRAKRDLRDRGGLVATDPKTLFTACKIHFHPKTKKYFLCKSEGNQEICCAKLGHSRWRIGAPLVKYRTDKMGNPRHPFNFDVLPWIFGEHVYYELKKMNEEFPLISHDLKIGCTNEEYQRLDLMPCNESIWQLKEEIKSEVLRAAIPVREFIKNNLAIDMSLLDLEGSLNDKVSDS